MAGHDSRSDGSPRLPPPLRLVDKLSPIARTEKGPSGHKPTVVRRPALAPPQAGPAPGPRRFYHVRPQRIAFHVTDHLIEILVRRHGKRLEPSLVHMPVSHLSPMSLPARDMRHRQTLH